METRVTEIADGIHQFTTYVPDADFSFNQYLVTGEEPLLFHTGGRQLFPLVSGAMADITPVDTLRWISFGHIESDESGSMNSWLAAAPASTVAQGMTGCMVSIGDLADRPPRPLQSGEVLDIGGHRMRWIDTPHVPHAWEAGLLYDETTRTLLCGDLFTRTGTYDAISDDDVVGPAIAAEDLFKACSLAPTTGRVIRGLAELDVDTLALMHGPAFTGDCRTALLDLADDFDRRIAAA
ncbi:MAG: oxygen-binding di-iron domain-containing protein [Acidimicrobiia bacterium]